MISYLGAQIGHHQVAFKAVASRLQVQVVRAEYISFYAIVTNYNEPLTTAQARIHVVTHIKVAKYWAILVLKLAIIRPYTKLQHCDYK
eukprot:scaffold16665_cov159-Skeletonema_menzelii.AAC.1